jgi:hypothetical protein
MQRAKPLAGSAIAADGYLSNPALAERYDVATRTIERWEDDPKLDFPPPDLIINSRKYRKLSTIESWERRRATSAAY